MYCDSTYRIIHTKYIVKEPYTEADEKSCYGTDNNSTECICYITSCCDSYKSCK